jgi:hypothetical protein
MPQHHNALSGFLYAHRFAAAYEEQWFGEHHFFLRFLAALELVEQSLERWVIGLHKALLTRINTSSDEKRLHCAYSSLSVCVIRM